jgi:hypothetical protein
VNLNEDDPRPGSYEPAPKREHRPTSLPRKALRERVGKLLETLPERPRWEDGTEGES